MGKKIFVSYKYKDTSVENLSKYEISSVRDYVTKFEEKLDPSDNIYKGENDGDDLSTLSEESIWQKLKDRIYDSSVTVVFISPEMKENSKEDKEQWIPWEISYSLKEVSRKNKNGDSITSKSNAMVAVVLPNKNGHYSYYLERKSCCNMQCMLHHTEKLFSILRNNKFNKIEATTNECEIGEMIWYGDSCYIEAVKWCDFINNYNTYIEKACDRQTNIDKYDIYKEV